MSPSIVRPGPSVPLVRVVCTEAATFHEKYGRTVVREFYRRNGRWWEVSIPRARPSHRSHDHLRSAPTVDDVANLPDPFPGALNPGLRPPVTTFLRGDAPADEREQRYIEEALERGTRTTPTSQESARTEDLAARAHVELRCRCGGRPLRARAEALAPIFDAFYDAGQHVIELRTLIRAYETRRASGR